MGDVKRWPYPQTLGGIELAMKELVPHVLDAYARTIGPGRLDIQLRGPWWFPWTLGFMRWRTKRRALAIAKMWVAAGTFVEVGFGLRKGN